MTSKVRFLASFLTGVFLLNGATASDDPVDLFIARAEKGQIEFVYIDPDDLGNPWAAPLELAQLTDTDGTLGRISVVDTMVGGERRAVGFWKVLGKGLVVVGKTAGGALAGAAVGVAVPGLGSGAGALVGGGGAFCAAVGDAILKNTSSPTVHKAQDVAMYEEVLVETQTGTVDLAAAILAAVASDASRLGIVLPGDGLLIVPDQSIFAGSQIVDAAGDPLPNCEVVVAVLDVDGNVGTPSDQLIAIIFQDLVRGIELTDEVMIAIDGVISPGVLAHGDAVMSTSVFAVSTWEGIPTVSEWGVAILTLLVLSAGTIVLVRRRLARAA